MKGFSKLISIIALALLGSFGGWSQAFAGFSVSGTQLLDGNGQPFVIRGINHAHTWFRGETQAFADIAATGANTVRVVLSNGTHASYGNRITASQVTTLINLCKQNQLICMLEVHDTTGGGEDASAGTIADAAAYWVSIADVLKGQEDYVLINIANEPIGNISNVESAWVNQHRSAIQAIRNAGLTHTLIVDAPNWGQDWMEAMRNSASQVANADSLNNTMFSVHMYEVYQDYNKINGYISGFLSDHNLPLIVGEFGSNHQGNFVDADSIMEVAEQRNIGYLGWSWSGNGSCCIELDIVNGFNGDSLTTWGQRLINGANGISSTSELASVYSGIINSSSSSSSSSLSSSSQSSSQSSANMCGIALSTAESDFYYCVSNNPMDDDGDGWGWENEASCIVPNGPADPNPGTCNLGGQSSSSSSQSSVSSISSVSSSTASSQSSSSSGGTTTGGSLERLMLLLLGLILCSRALRQRS